MGSRSLAMTAIALASTLVMPPQAESESIDGRVVQVQLPLEDATLLYVEMKGGMAIELKTATASFRGTKFFLGDVAVPMQVVPTRGIVFQGKTKLEQGFQFTEKTVVKVLPGYKRAVDLAPGDVYVILPGVVFEMPPR
jgi:hypothetical protein